MKYLQQSLIHVFSIGNQLIPMKQALMMVCVAIAVPMFQSAKGYINVVQMMKETLQPYMVNCLVAAGYDDFDAISTMNTSENYGNSIRKIDYIDLLLDHDQTKSLTPPAPYLRPFRFPPGHQVKLCNFV